MIRLLQTEDWKQAADIASLAYPGMLIQSDEKKKEFIERLETEQSQDNDIQFFGCFDEQSDELLGIFRVNDFECNINGKFQRIFGIGMVAVHLLHKKEKIAFKLLSYFHNYARQENIALVSLYPFNPSFYRKMGYGYGPLRYEFKFKPGALITDGNKSKVKFLSPSDEEAIVSLYNEYAQKNHGMFKRTWKEREYIKARKTYYVGVEEENRLVGALAFTLEPVKDSHFLHQHMIIHEWIWSNPSAYKQLASWVSSQQDQVDRVIFPTNDKSLVYSLSNPMNDSNHVIPSVYHEVAASGSGIMYRITNIETFVNDTNFHGLGKPQGNTKVLLEVEDSFIPEQQGIYELSYSSDQWKIHKVERNHGQANISIGIHDLSSWWMGCVTIESLYNYGEVKVQQQNPKELDDWFKPKNGPICFTSF
ncbi:Predicted acetyltransferase [Psychrobacillus sp. OK028]|uniref:GNAT family N-acetyltransferase n=1 Tax=Psychrobacillus sp. OK028 TaxID=1884359 RepID=UPI00088D62D3|nr:GNAT family N-acetyltransferase [Psychrobacillus sp. OK028]SDO00229.1 Predicted acetyltransferase [Psychrobacillus sp. OK028]